MQQLEALKLAENLVSRINHAFYVEGNTKALRPVMAETKSALKTMRDAIAEAEAGLIADQPLPVTSRES